MMTIELFERLLQQGESATLDFKREQYDFSATNDKEKEEKVAKFVKDIICFANTVRSKTAYIIIGVERKDTGEVILHGVAKHEPDNAMLQDKIKDKVYPISAFNYLPFAYQGKQFGIIEIPVVKYPEPCKPLKNMKGLVADKVYLRRDSSNQEAAEFEVVNIYDWLRSLAEVQEYNPNKRLLPNFNIQEKREIFLLGFGWFILLAIQFGVFSVISIYIKSILFVALLGFSVFVWFGYFTLRGIDKYLLSEAEKNRFQIKRFIGLYVMIVYWIGFIFLLTLDLENDAHLIALLFIVGALLSLVAVLAYKVLIERVINAKFLIEEVIDVMENKNKL